MDKETKELIGKGIIVCNDESVLEEDICVDTSLKELYNRCERKAHKMKKEQTPIKDNNDITLNEDLIKIYSPEVKDGVIILTSDIMSKEEWDEWE